MDAISKDIEAGLTSAGKTNAVEAFRRADSLWKDRIQYIDKTLEPLIGKGRSGESILSTVEGYMRDKGNAAQLRRVLRSMDANELGDVQATIVERMSKSTPGAQNATSDAFSPDTFLTNWNKLTPQAKDVMFQGELRTNLEQIARVAEGIKKTGRYANPSNSGGVVGWLLTTGAAGIDPTSAISFAGAQYLNGRLMTSPAFTRWLARAPKTNDPNAISAYSKQLGKIATTQPAIAADVKALQSALSDAFSQAPMRAAASGNEKPDGRLKPPQ
jgi:hypothetical protein